MITVVGSCYLYPIIYSILNHGIGEVKADIFLKVTSSEDLSNNSSVCVVSLPGDRSCSRV